MILPAFLAKIHFICITSNDCKISTYTPYHEGLVWFQGPASFRKYALSDSSVIYSFLFLLKEPAMIYTFSPENFPNQETISFPYKPYYLLLVPFRLLFAPHLRHVALSPSQSTKSLHPLGHTQNLNLPCLLIASKNSLVSLSVIIISLQITIVYTFSPENFPNQETIIFFLFVFVIYLKSPLAGNRFAKFIHYFILIRSRSCITIHHRYGIIINIPFFFNFLSQALC